MTQFDPSLQARMFMSGASLGTQVNAQAMRAAEYQRQLDAEQQARTFYAGELGKIRPTTNIDQHGNIQPGVTWGGMDYAGAPMNVLQDQFAKMQQENALRQQIGQAYPDLRPQHIDEIVRNTMLGRGGLRNMPMSPEVQAVMGGGQPITINGRQIDLDTARSMLNDINKQLEDPLFQGEQRRLMEQVRDQLIQQVYGAGGPQAGAVVEPQGPPTPTGNAGAGGEARLPGDTTESIPTKDAIAQLSNKYGLLFPNLRDALAAVEAVYGINLYGSAAVSDATLELVDAHLGRMLKYLPRGATSAPLTTQAGAKNALNRMDVTGAGAAGPGVAAGGRGLASGALIDDPVVGTPETQAHQFIGKKVRDLKLRGRHVVSRMGVPQDETLWRATLPDGREVEFKTERDGTIVEVDFTGTRYTGGSFDQFQPDLGPQGF